MKSFVSVCLASVFVFSSLPAFSDQIGFMVGVKSESIETAEGHVSRSSFSSVYGEYMRYLVWDLFMAVGGAGSLQWENLELASFDLEGSLRTFVWGDGRRQRLQGQDVHFVSDQTWNVFVGLGFSQRFLESENFDNETRGGLKLESGVHYHQSQRIYFSTHGRAILSGLGRSNEYTSYEIFMGAGYRF